MKRIKGYRKTKNNYIYKIVLKEVFEIPQTIFANNAEKQQKESNCFSLVVVRSIPWYKKLVISIRNLIIIYKWKKAR